MSAEVGAWWVQSPTQDTGSSVRPRSFEPISLVAENRPGEVQVALRRRHARVAGLRHHGDRRRTGRGVARDGGVAEVVERPELLLDPGCRQGGVELQLELLWVEVVAAARREDELVVAAVAALGICRRL